MLVSKCGVFVLTERVSCQSYEKISDEKQLRQFGGCFQGIMGIFWKDYPKVESDMWPTAMKMSLVTL